MISVKDKEKNASGSSSESDSSEDDENAYDPKFDAEFFKTLSSLKRKDPTIYERETKFFENVTTNAVSDGASTAKTKLLTVKQYEHNMLMETGGLSDPDDVDTSNVRSASPSYNDEQKQIKSEFKRVLEANDSEDDDTGDFAGLFTKREKTKQEQVGALHTRRIKLTITQLSNIDHSFRIMMMRNKKNGQKNMPK